MSDIKNLLNDFINLASSQTNTDSLWREEPVDFYTFITSTDFLNEEVYPGKQEEFVEKVNQILWYKFSGDEKLCPEELRRVTEMVVLFGKGSGKDFLVSFVLAYICYLLCCMSDPHGYFGFGKDEPIDIINIALNANQATGVFFKKLKARFQNCGWFKRVNYNPSEDNGAYNEYQFTRNQIRLYKNITCHSAHSEADSYEGFNPLVVIFDEIGGFEYERAENCYKTLRSSAATRYGSKMLLIFISFPRVANDYMMKKYKEATEKNDPEVFAMIGKTWEVNTKKSRSDFDKDYETDPEGSRCKYECIPPSYSDAFFKFPDRIDSCIRIGKKSQCTGLIVSNKITTRTLHNLEQRHFMGLEVYNLVLDPSYTYYLGGDCGVDNDSYTISLFHAEPVLIETVDNGQSIKKWINKPVEDLILEWRPSKKDRLPVDLLNVAEILEIICRQVFVKKALFDKFNSAEVVQRLMMYGVDAEDKAWSNPFQYQLYSNLKALIYSGQIELLDYQSPYEGVYEKIVNPNEELKAIQIINGTKIDHAKDKTKDFSDARAAGAYLCSMDEPMNTKHSAMPVIVGFTTRR